jgi:HK97 family phage prohead protease
MKQPDIEKRYTEAKLEIRAAEEGSKSRMIEGYALVFNSESRDLGGFTEIIMPEALKGADLSEVVARTHHDNNFLLARTQSKTLKLSVDERGLKYSFEAPNTTAGNDLLELVARGDIYESSFAFTIDRKNGGETWEDRGDGKPYLRTITAMDKIYDVAPVVTAAYPATDVAKRSMDDFKKSLEKAPEPEPEIDPIYNIEEKLTILKY